MKQRRVFIAINIPQDIKNKFKEYQNKWYDLPVRWTKPENLHITLVFIGYVNDKEALDICDAVKQVAQHFEPFNVDFRKIVLGPPNKPPRMIWAEGEKNQQIADLQERLERNIFHSGGAFGGKKSNAFHPHITIARVKQGAWHNLEEVPCIEENISLNFSVGSIDVMESRLDRGGAEYTVLESVELVI